MEYKSMEEAFNAGYEKAKQDMLNALNKDKKAYDKKKLKSLILWSMLRNNI